MAKLILQSTAFDPLFFFLVQAVDHITAATGLGATPTVTLSKNGAAFAAPAGAISEIANGWYQVAANATDTNTLGDLLLHATGTGADPCDLVAAQVVAFNPRTAIGEPYTTRIGTAQGGGSNTIILDAGASAVDNYYQGQTVYIRSGTGVGEASYIVAYSGTTKTATVYPAFATAPDITSVFGTVALGPGPFPPNMQVLSITPVGGRVNITSPIQQNTAQPNFMFVMTDVVNHSPTPGLTVTSQRAIDGGVFLACANTAVEIGFGTYSIALTAGDTNGVHIMYRFTASGADDLNIEVFTQP